ncbi:hypothetical protein G7085_06185 [Tessaracoccus sp. HDW20]|uniref:hypothetical protein n=1 Tax=Tessaracoccus coleopterorum TaxID=2714950 RepID=UPI0018D2ACC2|nr:hypothetical protein [Tessaracoccus coleopterorum]NHB84333.1 hypothetical protein [Tessaracoccus coleopterorum]
MLALECLLLAAVGAPVAYSAAGWAVAGLVAACACGWLAVSYWWPGPVGPHRRLRATGDGVSRRGRAGSPSPHPCSPRWCWPSCSPNSWRTSVTSTRGGTVHRRGSRQRPRRGTVTLALPWGEVATDLYFIQAEVGGTVTVWADPDDPGRLVSDDEPLDPSWALPLIALAPSSRWAGG